MSEICRITLNIVYTVLLCNCPIFTWPGREDRSYVCQLAHGSGNLYRRSKELTGLLICANTPHSFLSSLYPTYMLYKATLCQGIKQYLPHNGYPYYLEIFISKPCSD